jgi:hypothetical protein
MCSLLEIDFEHAFGRCLITVAAADRVSKSRGPCSKTAILRMEWRLLAKQKTC